MTQDGFLLHPVLLDAAFQMLGVPLLAQGEPFLPVGLERLELLATPGSALWCALRLRTADGPLVTADIDLADDDGRVVVRIVELRFQRASRRGARFAHPDWLYRLDWEPQALDLARAEWLPSPAAIAAALAPALAARFGDTAWYGDLWPGLDRLVAAYVRRALAELGLAWQAGRYIAGDELAQELGIVAGHRHLFGRLLSILAEQGEMTAAAGGWTLNESTLPPPETVAAQLAANFPQAGAELALVRQCGSGLAQALAGRSDGLDVLFPGGDFSVAARIYTDAPGARAINGLLRQAVAKAVAALPPQRALRVLEIGAGTGGTTAYLLPALPPACREYAYTDVSPLFLTQARARFGDYDFIDYRLLDIERDPLAQGCKPASYHLIVAANVLHATHDLKETLRHVATLLAPGGMLVLLEGMGPQPWLDVSFGLTEGWWRFNDAELRPDYPLLDVPRWKTLLQDGGFEAVEAISPDCAANRPVLRQAVLLARKPLAVAAETGVWLLLADRGGVAAGLAQSGLPCRIIDADAAITPELLRAQLGKQALRGIVHARALDVTAPNAAAEAGCKTLLDLLQALPALDLPLAPRLVLLTRGAVAADDDDVNPAQAPLWAMGQVLAAEYPELACRRIDLDAGTDAESIVRELAADAADNAIALRQGQRRVARLAALEQGSEEALVVRPEAAIIISGGLGDLGLATARWLVEDKGARRLVLAARRSLAEAGEEAQRQVAVMEAMGATVQVVATDVSDPQQVARLIAAAERDGPLGGVIHAAGILDDGVLAAMSWQRFAAVLAPKLAGAWNLHQACAGRPLDFFVLYSSLAAVFGPAAQANHAAANAYLDALAAYRRAQGLPAMSIAWGAWSAIGQAARKQAGGALDQKGIGSIAPAQGVAALAHLFAHPAAQAIVAPIHWDTFLAQTGAVPLFARWRQRAAAPTAAASVADLPSSLAGLPASEQRARVLARVRQEAARVLGLDGAQSIDIDLGFFDMGMDSLTAVELRNALQAAIGNSLPTTLLFKYPNARALADFLAGLLPGAAAPEATVSAAPATGGTSAAALDEVQGMSDAELAALIDAELAGMSGGAK